MIDHPRQPVRSAAGDITADSWRKTLLSDDATIQQAIRNLDESGLQIAVMVGSDSRLVGTITDGDVRRGLLRGLDMSSPAHAIVQREPLMVPPQLSREAALQLMRANKIHQLPILDEDRRVVGLHLLNELMTPVLRPNLMLIMAGGKGTRLLPRTEYCPKPMLMVGDKPMLGHIIERAKAEGFRHFVLAIHYLGHKIESYFGDGSRWDVRIDYIREESPLGTAGAVALLHPRPDASFLVCNGDVLTDVRYSEMLEFHSHHRAMATMAVRLHEWRHPFGVVRTKGVDLIGFEEKPIARNHVNAGIYVLEPSAIDVVRAGEVCDMPTVFNRLRERHARIIVYPVHEPWLDIGHPDALDWAQADYQLPRDTHAV